MFGVVPCQLIIVERAIMAESTNLNELIVRIRREEKAASDAKCKVAKLAHLGLAGLYRQQFPTTNQWEARYGRGTA